MTWFFIALGAPFLWGITNIFDQYLVTKYSTGERRSGGLVLFSSLIGVFVALLIGIFVPGLFEISHLDKMLLLLTGGITIAWVILYLFALEIEEVSSVVPWFLTVPIFGYIFGYFFLGETLSKNQMLGAIIVFLGLLILVTDFTGKKNKLKMKAGLYMICACMMLATSGIIFKYVTTSGNFWISSFWEYIGLGAIGIMIFAFVPKYRKEFIQMNKSGGMSIFTLNTVSEIMTILGNLLTNYAILLAPVTMVYLVGSFQPAIVLFFTILATKFFPKLAKENLSRQVLVPKIISVVIILAGTFVLFL